MPPGDQNIVVEYESFHDRSLSEKGQTYPTERYLYHQTWNMAQEVDPSSYLA